MKSADFKTKKDALEFAKYHKMVVLEKLPVRDINYPGYMVSCMCGTDVSDYIVIYDEQHHYRAILTICPTCGREYDNE